MRMQDFIKENREEVDRIIKSTPGTPEDLPLNDAERRTWIENDEGLYMWARSEGVPV